MIEIYKKRGLNRMTLEQYLNQLTEEQVEALLNLFDVNSFEEFLQFHSDEELVFDSDREQTYNDLLEDPLFFW